jgi:signal transduction histidine kinase
MRIDSNYRWALIAILGMAVVTTIVIFWSTNVRLREFNSYHQQTAESISRRLSFEIGSFIREQKRLAKVFVQSHQELIEDYIESPANIELEEKLSQEVKNFFPDHFAYTIADNNGIPIYDSLEGKIGDVCKSDIKAMTVTGDYQVHLHPNPIQYHFDIMTQVDIGNRKTVFFASFPTSYISRLLAVASPVGHELLLLNASEDRLIEIMETGDRLKRSLDNYHLTSEETERILTEEQVPGTDWILVDIHQPSLFVDYISQLLSTKLTILLLVLTLSAIMVVVLMKSERRRIIAEKNREEMFSLFTHDLRSPLNSIKGALKHIQKKVNDEDIKTLSALTLENAQTMSKLVNDILDAQKLEAGMMTFAIQRHDINTILGKVVEQNRPNAEDNHVDLQFEKSADNMTVNIDTMRFCQAMTNIISNAIKFSPDNETVLVRAEPKPGRVIITVHDNGPGIPKDFQPHVFEKFAQSKENLKHSIHGTGLGLAIVHSIIEMLDGSVSFESDSSNGTTFKIVLPAI